MRNKNPDMKFVDGVASTRRPSGMGALSETQRKIEDSFAERDRQAEQQRAAAAESERQARARAEAARVQAIAEQDRARHDAFMAAEAERQRAEAERQRQQQQRQRAQQNTTAALAAKQSGTIYERKPVFVPNPPHWSLQDFFRFAANRYCIVPRIYCNSGLNFSVQIGDNAYCDPRTWDAEEWDKAEIGFPSEVIPEIMAYVEDADMPLHTVYAYVPVSIIERVIEENGGIDYDKTAENASGRKPNPELVYGYGINTMTPDPHQNREENPSYVGKFERFFDGQIENRQKIGTWYVWDIGSPSGIHEFVGQAKDAGYQSAWAKHGQVGVLRSEVSDLGRSTNYGSRRNNPRH